MVGKNNFAKKMQAEAERKPHYGIRKFSVGVASVLLSMSLYFGVSALNTNNVFAATNNIETEQKKNTNEHNDSQEQEKLPDVQVKNNEEQTVKNDNNSSNSDDSKQENNIPENTDSQNKNGGVEKPDNSTILDTSNKKAFVGLADSKIEQSDRPITVDSRNYDGYVTPKSESVELSNGVKLSIDYDTVNKNSVSNGTSPKLTLAISNGRIGDTYRIYFPKFLGATNVEELSSLISVDKNGSFFVEDKFINNGSLTQHIDLGVYIDTVEDKYGSEFLKTLNISSMPAYMRLLSSIKIEKVNGDEKELPVSYQYGNFSLNLSNADLDGQGTFPSKPFLNGSTHLYEGSFDIMPSYFKDLPPVNRELSIKMAPDINIKDNKLTISRTGYNPIVLTGTKEGNVLHFNLPENLPTDEELKATFDWNLNIPKSKFNSDGQASEYIPSDSYSSFNITSKVSSTNTLVAPQTDEQTIGKIKVIGDLKDYHGQIIKINQKHTFLEEGDTDNVHFGTQDTKNVNNESYVYFGKSEKQPFQTLSLNLSTNLTNATVTYNIPDGLLLNGDCNIGNGDKVSEATVIYQDNTTQTLNSISNSKIALSSTKAVKSITFRFSGRKIPFPDLTQMTYKVQKKYQNGNPVEPNTVLKYTGEVTADEIGDSGLLDLGQILIVPRDEVKKLGSFSVSASENDTAPRKESIGIKLTVSDKAGGVFDLTNPVFYVEYNSLMIPDITGSKAVITTSIDNDSGQEISGAKFSIIKSNGKNYLKIELPGHFTDKKYGTIQSDEIYVNVPIINTSDSLNSQKPFKVYMASDDSNLDEQFSDSKLPSNEMLNIDGKEIHIGSSQLQWSIETATGFSSTTMQEGNMDGAPSQDAKTDNHKGDSFNLYSSIINATDNNFEHISQYVNIPEIADGCSGFDTELTGAGQLINAINGEPVTDASITYSTSPANIIAENESDEPTDYVTADNVQNWTKIRSIHIQKANMVGNSVYRLNLPAKDKNIHNDVGKTSYMSSVLFGTQQKDNIEIPIHYTVKLKSDTSAKLTIFGKSIVNTVIRVKKIDGTIEDILLPDKSQVYNEITQTMKRDDFITKDINLTNLDNSLLPSHLIIDYANPTIEDSHNDGTAAFGQQVKYYFDGDNVVFKGTEFDPAVENTKAALKFFDDTAGTYITGCADLTDKDHTKANISFNIPTSYNDILKDYVFQGTKEGTDPHSGTAVSGTVLNNVIYGNWTNKDRTFIAHFTHAVEQVDKDHPHNDKDGKPINTEKTITRTIHYVTKDAQGNKTDIAGHTPIEQDVTYTAKGYLDKVTRKWVKSATDLTPVDDQSKGLTWTTADSFAAQPSPAVTNYHITGIENKDGSRNVNDADGNNIKKVTPEQSASNYDVYVVYAHDQTPAKVIYQDVNDPDHPKEIKTENIPAGDVDSQIPYSTKDELKALTDEGYVLVSNGFDPNGKAPSYNSDKSKNTYYVKLKHDQITVTPDKPGKPDDPINPKDPRSDKDKAKYPKGTDKASLQVTVPREIEYLYSNGTPKAGQAIHDSHNDSITFNATKVIDKVTGKVMSTKWDGPKDFDDVNSPTIPGYSPNRTVVRDKNVKYQDGEKVNKIVEDVYYAPDKQKATLKFIDDDGQDLSSNNKDDNGVTNGDIKFDGAEDEFNKLLNKGYEFVGARDTTDSKNPKKLNGNKYSEFKFGKFDTDKKVDQVFELHFRHGTYTTTNTKDVKRTINYVDQDGNKVAEPVNDVLHFTETQEIDKVTGNIISDTWTPAQDFATIPSPEVKGYTPDRTSVSDKNIDHTHADITETVTYTKNPVKKPEVKKPHKKTPKPTPEKKHHKVTKHTKTPKKEHKYNENFGVHGQDMNMRGKRHNNSYDNVTPLSTHANVGNRNGVADNNGSSALVQGNNAKAELPQTGESQNKLGLIGLAFASIAGLFGLAADRKRKN